jgi:hypothetical protein
VLHRHFLRAELTAAPQAEGAHVGTGGSHLAADVVEEIVILDHLTMESTRSKFERFEFWGRLLKVS